MLISYNPIQHSDCVYKISLADRSILEIQVYSFQSHCRTGSRSVLPKYKVEWKLANRQINGFDWIYVGIEEDYNSPK